MTEMVKDCDDPVQPLRVGVTVMLATAVVVPELVAVNELIFPEPLAARPMEVLSFVQLNVAPAAPVKVIAAVDALLQIIWSAGSLTVGTAFTVITVVAGVRHTPPVGV